MNNDENSILIESRQAPHASKLLQLKCRSSFTVAHSSEILPSSSCAEVYNIHAVCFLYYLKVVIIFFIHAVLKCNSFISVAGVTPNEKIRFLLTRPTADFFLFIDYITLLNE